MNPKVAAILQALAPALEAAVADTATVFGGPAVGAAVAMGEGVLNAVVGIKADGTPGTVAAQPAKSSAPVGSVAATGIQPHVDDPSTHPVIAASGRAAQVPKQVATGSLPADDDMSFPDLYARVAAIEAKLNAHIAATGLAGSAAMAAHP